ncbi:MAG: phosphoglycerate mutase family protein [Planctomycetota bacterium]|nr:phosphoglycerate mutase family protein [Planctomycetota bacterium]
MRIILIKYPQSKLDTLPLHTAFPPDHELGLTQKGIDNAELLGKNLASSLNGRFSVWCGSALRTAETADIVAKHVGAKPQSDLRLDERKLFSGSSAVTVGDFRLRQERAYIDPIRLALDEDESPVSHRLRVEAWLAERLGRSNSDEILIVVSHGAVVEHLHSALSWKPAGAMVASFAFCAPAHGHVWGAVNLPDDRRIFCCLGANVRLADTVASSTALQGLDDLDSLAVELASDPRFQQNRPPDPAVAMVSKYYIR